MDSNLLYDQFWQQLASCNNITDEFVSSLRILVYQSYWENKFKEPMLWIGIYIALASLFCLLAMVADLLHGLRNRRLWFPCKYFTLNAASLTVIAVAIKLPMDLTSQTMDAKLGSMAFMCTMMANLLPSLAIMNSKELVSNMIALGLLVITLVVNVCIQINTGAFTYHVDKAAFKVSFVDVKISPAADDYVLLASVYVGFLLMLLIIYACSSLGILKSKQLLESKYQAAHQTILKNQELQQPGRLTVEKLQQLLRNNWIMAETGSPQFMTACSATTSASAVICAFSTIVHILIILYIIQSHYSARSQFKSDYKWSMVVTIAIQSIGAVLGTIAPISRCFAALSFKLSGKWIWNHIKVFNVESYWIQKLSDWKHSSTPFPFGGRKCKIVIQKLNILALNICIGFQKITVIACKIIAVVPVFLVICVFFSSQCWKWMKAIFCSVSVNLLVQMPNEQPEKDKDLSKYVLQLQDDMEFAERTLKVISKSVNRLIQNAEKQQPTNLMKLLEKSGGFEGVEMFDNHHVPALLSEEYLNCWSLPLVTLTTIAMSLPKIQNNVVDSLLSGVSEGLVYVTLVEESLNPSDDHVSIKKAAQALWVDVEVYHKWLGNKLPKPGTQVSTARQILQWLRDTAKNMVIEVESTDIGVPNDNSKYKFISTNSMYRITESILLSYHENIEGVSQEELFKKLSSMIANILAACLTNLPQVIAMKCYTRTIEKREASIHAATQLLGETTQIINTLQERELPQLDTNELAFIEKWWAYLKDPFP